jgi:hypothetical protein
VLEGCTGGVNNGPQSGAQFFEKNGPAVCQWRKRLAQDQRFLALRYLGSETLRAPHDEAADLYG